MAQNISPQQAQEWLVSGEAILIDVREADEFKAMHIPYAYSLPLSTIEESFSLLKIPVNKKIIFQCLKGMRGEKACAIINNKKCCENEIYNIEGGIEAWEAASLPVVSAGAGPKMSIFRQVQIIVGGLVALMTVLGLSGVTIGFYIAGFLGAALCFAGITGWCGLAMVLSKMPWNRQ